MPDSSESSDSDEDSQQSSIDEDSASEDSQQSSIDKGSDTDVSASDTAQPGSSNVLSGCFGSLGDIMCGMTAFGVAIITLFKKKND